MWAFIRTTFIVTVFKVTVDILGLISLNSLIIDSCTANLVLNWWFCSHLSLKIVIFDILVVPESYHLTSCSATHFISYLSTSLTKSVAAPSLYKVRTFQVLIINFLFPVCFPNNLLHMSPKRYFFLEQDR